MADTKPERQKPRSEPQPERPVAEHEPLTITVIEPAASHETSVRVRVPHDTTIREPEHVTRIPVPRWYWLLVGVAATLLFLDYKEVWEPRIVKVMEHRILPPRVVRIEDSLWRHTFGDPKQGSEPNPRASDGGLRPVPPAPGGKE